MTTSPGRRWTAARLGSRSCRPWGLTPPVPPWGAASAGPQQLLGGAAAEQQRGGGRVLCPNMVNPNPDLDPELKTGSRNGDTPQAPGGPTPSWCGRHGGGCSFWKSPRQPHQQRQSVRGIVVVMMMRKAAVVLMALMMMRGGPTLHRAGGAGHEEAPMPRAGPPPRAPRLCLLLLQPRPPPRCPSRRRSRRAR